MQLVFRLCTDSQCLGSGPLLRVFAIYSPLLKVLRDLVYVTQFCVSPVLCWDHTEGQCPQTAPRVRQLTLAKTSCKQCTTGLYNGAS